MKKINSLFNLIILIICFFNAGIFIFADAAPISPASGSTVVPIYDTDIVLKHEIINIYLKRHEFYVEVEYLFVNTSLANNVTMGFPNILVPSLTEPIEDFKAFDSGAELYVYRKDTPSKYEWEEYYYECFDVSFDAYESKNIKNTYSSEYSTSWGYKMQRNMYYILTTGALWHEDIDNILVNIYIEGISLQELYGREVICSDIDITNYDEEEIISGIDFSPYGIKVNDFYYFMEFKDVEPDFDIKVTLPLLLSGHAESSSELEAGSRYSYSADNICDYDPATSWVEGVRGNGVGEYVSYHMDYYFQKRFYMYTIEKFGIINGFAENETLFYSNNRVKTIKLEFKSLENGSFIPQSVIIELEDIMSMQYYYFDEPVIAKTFKIIIEDVYPGSEWDDTCMAEFQVFPVNID